MQRILFFWAILLMMAACDKSKGPHPKLDCVLLNTALIDRDLERIQQQIDPLAEDLLPQPTSGDAIGHEQNLQILVDRLNQQCDDYSASVICYACIETFPVQSEISFELTENGEKAIRIIDLRTAEDAPLEVVNVHDP